MQNKCSNNKERSAHKNGNVTQELLQKANARTKAKRNEQPEDVGCRATTHKRKRERECVR